MYQIESSKDIYTRLVDKIWDEHSEIQTLMIQEFGKQFRKCEVEQLIKYKAFLVPNNSYLISLINDISAPQYGMYRGSKCMFNKRLLIPLIGFDGKVHSFIGYDNGNEVTELKEKLGHIYYIYQGKEHFKKERYMFITPEEYRQALEQDYICLTDGVFDKVSVSSTGIPCASLMSSRLTKYHIDYLRYIKNWIVLADNDDAGDLLTDICKQANPNTIRLHFDEAGDIDEFLMRGYENKERFLSSMEEVEVMGKFIDWGIK